MAIGQTEAGAGDGAGMRVVQRVLTNSSSMSTAAGGRGSMTRVRSRSGLLSRHRLGDTEVNGQTRVFIEGDRGDNQKGTRGEYCTR